MYFIDRNKIIEALTYLDLLLNELDQQTYKSLFDKLFLERVTQLIIESILDVGNMMIDGFVMRDPGSYADIIDILVDEKVLLEKDKKGYKEVIELREMIVRYYLEIDHDLIYHTLVKNKQKLDEFSNCIKTYLDNELGVAHAFANE